jgi:hypothetical protein
MILVHFTKLHRFSHATWSGFSLSIGVIINKWMAIDSGMRESCDT